MLVHCQSLRVFVVVGIALSAALADVGTGLPVPASYVSGTRRVHTGFARTVHLRNDAWTQVRVEVRAGSYASCDSLGTLGVQLLRRGQEWEVRFDDPVICWRRDQTPGDAASSWSAWNQLKLADEEVRAVTL